jgi:hypothetical protein
MPDLAREISMTSPPRHRFTVTIADDGAIPVDFDQRAVFGRARPPVVVEVGGHRYRSTIAVMNGVTFVPLRRSNREAAGVTQGDVVEVTLTLDTEPRTIELPGVLANALDTASVRLGRERLSYSAQREQVAAVESARRPETRAKRIAAAIALAATRV